VIFRKRIHCEMYFRTKEIYRNWNENAKIQRYSYFSNSNHVRSEWQTRHYHQIPIFPQGKTVYKWNDFINKTSQLTISAEIISRIIYKFDWDRHFFIGFGGKKNRNTCISDSFNFFLNIHFQIIFSLNIATFKNFIGRIKKY
jgi:hypothetical protein